MDTEYKRIKASNNINSLTEYYNKKREFYKFLYLKNSLNYFNY